MPATRDKQRPCFHLAGLLALALWLVALPLAARAAGAEGTEGPPEAPARPQLSFPGHPALQASVGAVHALALENLLALNTIRDPKHDHNRSGLFRDPPGTFTRAGGDYQTPWTRDASINSWNANSLLAPAVAANTLWAVVERQNGKLIVQQDNQWWDQVIWIPAAWNHFLVTGDRAFLAPAYEAATQTLARRRDKNFNAAFGLFSGPSFFNDGIAGYPPPLGDTGGKDSFVLDHPGTDKIMALSTNCLYVAAYRAAAGFACELGRPPSEARDFDQKADALAAAINARLWNPDARAYGYFLYGSGPDIGKMEKYQEGSGLAFAVLFGVADATRARALVADAHRQPEGITSIWPNFATFSDAKPGRHNNVIWPLVNGLFAHAAATVGATGIMADEIVGQANLALASKDFREVYNATTGAVDGGWQNGNHWGSAIHQTWSASSFLRAVYLGVFGLGFERDGLRFNPRLPADWSGVQLTGLPYRAGQLDLTLTGVGTRVTRLALDGRPVPGNFIAAGDLTGRHRVEITLAPQEPAAP